MTLIDKAEALLPCPFCGGTDLYFPHGTDPAVIECSGCGARSGVPDEQTKAVAIAAWNRRAAIPARGVGVKPCGGCGNDDPLKRCIGCFHDFGTPDSAWVYKYAALAPTDAAHVNETPKSEHDGADVLTAAQARDAALSVLSGLSSYLGTGLGDDDTTAEQFDKRIRWAIDDLTARTRQAALREAAAEVQRWLHDGRDNRDPAALILALIEEPRT